MDEVEGRASGLSSVYVRVMVSVIIALHLLQIIFIFLRKTFFSKMTYSGNWEAEAGGLPLV